MAAQKRFILAFMLAVVLHVLAGLFLLTYEFTAVEAPTDSVFEIELSGSAGPEGNSGPEQIEQATSKPENVEDSTTKQYDDTVAQQYVKTVSQPSSSKQIQGANVRVGTGAASNGNGSENSGDHGRKGSTSTRPAIMPKVISSVRPIYPQLARDRGVSGTVYLRVLVNSSGGVDDASIKQSSGYGYLDNAALEAIYSWQFRPAKNEQGEAINCYVNLPIQFDLKNASK